MLTTDLPISRQKVPAVPDTQATSPGANMLSGDMALLKIHFIRATIKLKHVLMVVQCDCSKKKEQYD